MQPTSPQRPAGSGASCIPRGNMTSTGASASHETENPGPRSETAKTVNRIARCSIWVIASVLLGAAVLTPWTLRAALIAGVGGWLLFVGSAVAVYLVRGRKARAAR